MKTFQLGWDLKSWTSEEELQKHFFWGMVHKLQFSSNGCWENNQRRAGDNEEAEQKHEQPLTQFGRQGE